MTLGDFKDITEGVAWLSAGAFFVYRAFTGYFIANMSVVLKCERQRILGTEADRLRIELVLAKGPSGTVSIHDAQARLSWQGAKEEERYVRFPAANRLSFDTLDGRKIIDWKTLSKTNPFTNLSPGESTQFVCHYTVPSESTCSVEVAVIGKVVWSNYISQWRASDVSFPLLPNAPTSVPKQ